MYTHKMIDIGTGEIAFIKGLREISKLRITIESAASWDEAVLEHGFTVKYWELRFDNFGLTAHAGVVTDGNLEVYVKPLLGLATDWPETIARARTTAERQAAITWITLSFNCWPNVDVQKAQEFVTEIIECIGEC